MIKSILTKLRASDFIRECMLFDSKVPYYWFLGVMGWVSFVIFIYAGLALASLGI
ncbi:MAG: hypothetical protein RIB47_11140 [Cyclobacteriaceae bacterium]